MSNDIWSAMGYSTQLTNNVSNSSTSSRSRSEDAGIMDKTAFMQLLMAQMQNQDPLSPMDTQDYFAQLAQFSMLEQMWNMNESLEQMQSQQQLLQGSALIGRTVEYDGGEGTTQTGSVSGIQVLSGQIFVDVEGVLVSLDSVVAVTE
jgi:flagellar basal-body rod modification protein FlgD